MPEPAPYPRTLEELRAYIRTCIRAVALSADELDLMLMLRAVARNAEDLAERHGQEMAFEVMEQALTAIIDRVTQETSDA
jgi:deoxyribose-phosphate aldolase